MSCCFKYQKIQNKFELVYTVEFCSGVFWSSEMKTALRLFLVRLGHKLMIPTIIQISLLVFTVSQTCTSFLVGSLKHKTSFEFWLLLLCLMCMHGAMSTTGCLMLLKGGLTFFKSLKSFLGVNLIHVFSLFCSKVFCLYSELTNLTMFWSFACKAVPLTEFMRRKPSLYRKQTRNSYEHVKSRNFPEGNPS